MIQDLLGRISGGQSLSLEEMSGVIDQVMQGRWTEPEIALLLTALREKGESVDEVAGAALAMRRHMTPIHSRRERLVDTCGTGGGGGGVMNISTAAALVAAAAGAAVAKHGNRKVTSKSGSADVLEELGVNVHAPISTVERCLDELGVCFCFAPQCHPAMKSVAQVRRELGGPSIFNLLGPLCNPAGAKFQLLGVVRSELRPLLAQALARLGVERALVVCAEDGLGEISPSAPTHVTEVQGDELREFVWRPADFGLPEAPRTAIQADGPQASAALIREVLAGQAGPPRDVVVMNAAAALWLVGLEATLAAAVVRAERALDTGAAAEVLQRLAALSRT